MKYKLLANGNNLAIIKDFLGYTGMYFDCISTTDVLKDLTKHFELLKPDAFLCFIESVYDTSLEQIQKLKNSSEYNSAPIVLVAKKETYHELEDECYQGLADLVLVRPITPDNIVLRILNYLEEKKNSAESVESDEKKHILVVDDDRNMLKLLKSALEEKYEVTATLNGVLVEKILSSKNIDLIILDYEMPIMTGADVFRQIKQNENFAKIPVCFLTGVSERSKVEEIMALRPNGYLLKPIEMDMLLATIENII